MATKKAKTKTVATPVEDLVKTDRGFHLIDIDKVDADAFLRTQKKSVTTSAKNNIQKGDFIVFHCNDYLHDINYLVWKASFVSYIPFSTTHDGYGQVSVSVNKLSNATFYSGGVGKYLEDTIVRTLSK